MSAFRKELEQLINKHSIENTSNTPDFILANYIVSCLDLFEQGIIQREIYYGRMNDSNRKNVLDDIKHNIIPYVPSKDRTNLHDGYQPKNNLNNG